MTATAAPLPCAGSPHLDLVVDEVARLAARVEAACAARAHADGHADAIGALRTEQDARTAAASLRLDGGLRATADGDGIERPGTWLDALGGAVAAGEDGAGGATADGTADGVADGMAAVDEGELARLSALEQAGVTAGVAADDLADAFGRASADAGGLGTALALLHGRITAGLVAPERAGRLRAGPRVVHDASVGRVLFFPTDPALLPDAWDQLLRHLTGSGAGAGAARAPAAVRAALLHLELVRHQPFDAANGRLARAAARLALLADGLLPHGLGTPDTVLAEDPLGYHEEVGASMRRRDATRWVERALEAHGIALQRTLDELGAPDEPDRVADGLPGELPGTLPAELPDGFTLGDVVEVTGTSSTAARERCSMWVVAGAAERVVGSGGLRLERRLGRRL